MRNKLIVAAVLALVLVVVAVPAVAVQTQDSAGVEAQQPAGVSWWGQLLKLLGWGGGGGELLKSDPAGGSLVDPGAGTTAIEDPPQQCEGESGGCLDPDG